MRHYHGNITHDARGFTAEYKGYTYMELNSMFTLEYMVTRESFNGTLVTRKYAGSASHDALASKHYIAFMNRVDKAIGY